MRVQFFVLVAAVVAFSDTYAFAEKRVALVVGNSAYQNVKRLDNPKNDALLMAKTLQGLGFALVGGNAQLDLDKPALDKMVQSFGQQVRGADVALFYYAGHGVQVSGSNYLVPVDANPTRETDVDFQMVDANLVLRQMQSPSKRLNLVILDACRNNPFGGRGLGRDTDGGLAQMRAPAGTLISYATQPGAVAQDGSDGDSPYTKALAKTISRTGLDVFQTFNQVGLEVERSTGGAQQPWTSSSPIDGSFYFGGAPTTNIGPSVDEAAWGFVKDTKDAEQIHRFVAQFPDSARRNEASARLNEIEKGLANQKKVAVLVPPATSVTPPPPTLPSVVVPQVKPAVPLPSVQQAAIVPVAPASPCGSAVLVSVSSRAAQSLSKAEECALKPKDAFKECDNCPEMVIVPPGVFTMGSPAAEVHDPIARASEQPLHRVTMQKAFAVGRFSVTFDEWDACVAAGGCKGYRPPDEDWGRGRRPVIRVSWNDAKSYVAWLSQVSGKSYRLLSEAEREYVTRAGSNTSFWWGSTITTKQANYDVTDGATLNGYYPKGGAKSDRTVPVDSYEPNPWGLYQVHGNVNEWVEDCWHESYARAPTDGSAWITDCGGNGTAVIRGGEWSMPKLMLRSGSRLHGSTNDDRSDSGGFRVARTL